MAEPAITVEGVSKRYQLGTGHEGMLSQRLEQALRAPIRRLRGRDAAQKKRTDEEFWALRDVSLEVRRGEVLGLIGANGAGKSTLLKLLSRITDPTAGRITLHGRVGSLLEVGTGFHPELTGRENIYLNGAILGMGREEIEQKFEEIIEFAGIPDFLDTPVKRYSSGMYVRLAFAVAAHLETEILLVDEVLSVGDTEFQRKSLGKMDAVASAGRTIVFVSHNLSAIQRLCSRTVWIDKGRVAADGPTQDVLVEYLRRSGANQLGGEATIGADVHRVGTGEARLVHLALVNADGEVSDQVRSGEHFSIRLTFEVSKRIDDVAIEVGICSADGTRIVTVQNIDGDQPTFALDPGTHEVTVALSMAMLPGDFTVDAAIADRGSGTTYDYVERALTFAGVNVAYRGTDTYAWNVVRGSVRVDSDWSVRSGVSPAATVRPG
jgi:lipopolysaccharide transport system ATP-binding protein